MFFNNQTKDLSFVRKGSANGRIYNVIINDAKPSKYTCAKGEAKTRLELNQASANDGNANESNVDKSNDDESNGLKSDDNK